MIPSRETYSILLISFFTSHADDTSGARKRKDLPVSPSVVRPSPRPFHTPAGSIPEEGAMFPFSEEQRRIQVLPKRICRDNSNVPDSRAQSRKSLFDIIEELKDDTNREPQ
jgi:hypothetical protein